MTKSQKSESLVTLISLSKLTLLSESLSTSVLKSTFPLFTLTLKEESPLFSNFLVKVCVLPSVVIFTLADPVVLSPEELLLIETFVLLNVYCCVFSCFGFETDESADFSEVLTVWAGVTLISLFAWLGLFFDSKIARTHTSSATPPIEIIL